MPAKLGPKGKVLRYPEDLIDHTTDYFQIEILKNIKDFSGGFGDIMESKDIPAVEGKEASVDPETGKTIPAVKAQKADTQTRLSQEGFNKVFAGGRGSQISDQYKNVPAEKVIILPIPQNINDNNGASWGESKLNDFAAWGLQKADDLMSANFDELPAAAKDGLGVDGKAMATGVASYGKLVAGVSAVNALGGNVSVQGLLSRATGQIINQNVEMLFNGVQVRSFNFGFDLVPRSIDESMIIKDIVRSLKINSAAKMKKGKMGFLNAPNVFRLTYMKGGSAHPFLNSFKTCALKNIAMTYTGGGTYATYEDGTPVHMKMDLSFTELNPIYAEDHDNVGGVGY